MSERDPIGPRRRSRADLLAFAAACVSFGVWLFCSYPVRGLLARAEVLFRKFL